MPILSFLTYCSHLGKVRAIGLSNASEKTVEEILKTATIPPAVDQLELHLYNPQHELTDYLKRKGIVPQAYSPLGSTGAPLLQDETTVEIAQKHSLQPSDVLLGYLRMSYLFTRFVGTILIPLFPNYVQSRKDSSSCRSLSRPRASLVTFREQSQHRRRSPKRILKSSTASQHQESKSGMSVQYRYVAYTV